MLVVVEVNAVRVSFFSEALNHSRIPLPFDGVYGGGWSAFQVEDEERGEERRLRGGGGWAERGR